MHDEAQMVRRVKAYLAQRQIIKNEDELKKLSQKCEPDPERTKSITPQVSTTSVASTVSVIIFLRLPGVNIFPYAHIFIWE